MRSCSRCKLDKADEAFSGKDPYCRACRRDYMRDYHRDPANKERIRANRDARLRNLIVDYLAEHGCADCGEQDPVVLELQHRRGERAFDIAVAMRGNTSAARLLAELPKYDVVCANCHRRRVMTAETWTWTTRR